MIKWYLKKTRPIFQIFIFYWSRCNILAIMEVLLAVIAPLCLEYCKVYFQKKIKISKKWPRFLPNKSTVAGSGTVHGLLILYVINDRLTSPKAPRPITTSGSKSSFPSRVLLRRRNSVSFDAWFFLFSFFSSSDFEAKKVSSITFIKEIVNQQRLRLWKWLIARLNKFLKWKFLIFAYSFSGFS